MTVSRKSAARSQLPSQGDPFQGLLRDLSAAAAQGKAFPALIRLFCRSAKALLNVSGVYYWHLQPPDSVVGAGGDGTYSARLPGLKLSLDAQSAVCEAIRTRAGVFANQVTEDDPVAARTKAKALMAAPLMVAGKVRGAISFVDTANADAFSSELAQKAAMLGAVLGSVVESARLNSTSLRERRKAELLLDCARVLHSRLEVPGVIAELAARVRELLDASFAVVLKRSAETFHLAAVAAPAEVEAKIRAAHEQGDCDFAARLAQQAVAERKPVTLKINEADHPPQFLVGGEALAAPFQTAQGEHVIVAFAAERARFRSEHASLLAATLSFGSLAVSNAELYATADARAKELQQLLEIVSELSSVGKLDEFFRKFVLRSAEFLGFKRAMIALFDGSQCVVRWLAEGGEARPVQVPLPEGFCQRLLAGSEPFSTNDISRAPQVELPTSELQIKQILAAPLRNAEGKPQGFLAVLDSCDGGPISPEDIRRAKVLATEVAVVLDSTHNFHISQEHRQRSEDLMSLALEMNSSLRLPQFVRTFTERAANMLGARAAALALAQAALLEIVVLHDPDRRHDKSLVRRLNIALSDLRAHRGEAVVGAPAAKLLGPDLASALGWKDLVLARLCAGEDLIGMLLLVDRGEELTALDTNVLRALAAHASVALENARLFTRMDQANRHWIEIFDSISDFIVVHDESNKVLRVNRSLADFIGVRPGELIGVSMRALVAMASDAIDQPCPFCRAGMETGDEYIHPVLERTYLVSTSRIHGGANEAYQTIHVLKDITDRREAERRYRELFDTIQEGLFFTTPEGRFIEVNDALVRMLGYDSRGELLKADIPTQIYLTPEDRIRFRRAIEQHGFLRNYEESLRRKDDTLIHVLQNAFAVRDAQGQIIQYRGLMLDITEQKNFQAELERQRDFNNKILNATQSMILVVDSGGLISYANRRCFEAGGYTHDELLGHPLVELVAPGRREVLSDALSTTLQGQQVDNLEIPILLGRGRIGQFAINLSPMRDESGSVSSIVVVMTDITDSAMLQAKLMHTEKMAAVGQLVSGVAHEVNNPLTAILGFADLLMEHPEIPEFAKADLRVILEEAQRTKQIVQNLLSFARQTPPQRRPVAIEQILRQTIALRAYDFANHGMEVVERFDDRLPEVVGDSHQLQQVFVNILNNAYDAVRETGRTGQIVIRTAHKNGFAEVAFRDNGSGIRYPERIFDPFFTTKEVGKGTGLGLSICYGILREHGGEIVCCNNSDSPGATFTVRLPLARQRVAGAEAAGAAQ